MNMILTLAQFTDLPPAPTLSPALRRPRLLIAAAKAGQSGWNRDRGLRGLLRLEPLPGTLQLMRLLLAQEAVCDQHRREKSAEYDLQRHILFLIAILAEVRLAAGDHAASRALAQG